MRARHSVGEAPRRVRWYRGRVIRLELFGAHTRVHAALCAACPQGRAGCCASPPAVAWADVGRIVSLGGRDFLLAEMAAGNLRPSERGLLIRRVEASEGFPRRCVYLGVDGCSIPAERRSATCNYYVCEDALAQGEEKEAGRARDACEALTNLYGAWDLEIAEEVLARYPEGAPWDEAFLDWLGEAFERRLRKKRRALGRLMP